MRFAALGSGSQGNGLLVAADSGVLLVDCGFTIKETQARLARLGLTPQDISAILVTHEHGDHSKGVGPFARKFKLPVYATPGTWDTGRLGKIEQAFDIRGFAPFELAGIAITPVAVPHDARETAQFVFSANGWRLGLMTDLGSLTDHVIDSYADCHALVLEANHDPVMLAQGPYPPSLKRRVAGPWGHLSNQQAAQFLQQVHRPNLHHLVIAHISQKNNDLAIVRRVLAPCLEAVPQVTYACQDHGFDWLDVRDAAGAVQSASG